MEPNQEAIEYLVKVERLTAIVKSLEIGETEDAVHRILQVGYFGLNRCHCTRNTSQAPTRENRDSAGEPYGSGKDDRAQPAKNSIT